MNEYRIMHKNRDCGVITLDPVSGALVHCSINSYGPYLGKADLDKMKRWWRLRAVPASRKFDKGSSETRKNTEFRIISCQESGIEHNGLLLDLPGRIIITLGGCKPAKFQQE